MVRTIADVCGFQHGNQAIIGRVQLHCGLLSPRASASTLCVTEPSRRSASSKITAGAIAGWLSHLTLRRRFVQTCSMCRHGRAALAETRLDPTCNVGIALPFCGLAGATAQAILPSTASRRCQSILCAVFEGERTSGRSQDAAFPRDLDSYGHSFDRR